MQDEVGTDSLFRECDHTFVSHDFPNPRTLHIFPQGSSSNAFIQNVVTATTITQLGTLAAPPDVDMNVLADQACAFMIPSLNEGSSLINFLIELKDLKSWTRGGSAIARIKGRRLDARGRYTGSRNEDEAIGDLPYSDLFYRLPGGRKKMLKDIIKRLTGAHLEASFGVVPFFKDLVGMVNELGTLALRIDDLKRHANQRQVRHYRRRLPDLSGNPTVRDWEQLTSGTKAWVSPYASDHPTGRPSIRYKMQRRWILRPVYHATMRFNYSLPSMGEMEEQIWTTLDSLGVRLDPSILWNAIPYSFIVDWIADVSGFLQTFARDNFPIETRITDFCHSLAYHYEAQITANYDHQSSTTVAPYMAYWPSYKTTAETGALYSRSVKSYKRVRYSPDIHAIAIKRVKLRQAALSGSLIINKLLGGKGKVRTSA
jgi:hypothetical protein